MPATVAPPRRCAAGPTVVDPDRQAELEQFGFTVVPLFDADQLAEVRRISAEIGPAPDDPRVALNWSFHSRSRAHKESVRQVLDVARPALEATFRDHVAYLTTFITKWPGPHSAFPPHQDPSLVDERHHTGVTVWAPLADVGADNGMLHVVPGSHRFSTGLRLQDVDQSPYAGLEGAIVGSHGRGVPMEAGEAMVFDNRLIHYSLPNTSPDPRVVVSFGMRPREGRCVVVLAEDEGTVAVHEVHDDFYVDVLPAQRDRWQPSGAPIARVANPVEVWTAETLASLCAQAGDAPRAVPGAVPTDAALDPGVFCAHCGTTEGLSADDRTGRTNAQLLCPRCAAELAELAGG